MTAPSSNSQSFVEFLHELNARTEGERQGIVDCFMSSLRAVPYVEKDSLVHFLFLGDVASVTIPCDANEWYPSDFPMKRVNGTNFWYYTHRLEPDARLDYKFLLNGSEWILDPLNPRQIEGGYGLNSELRMPKYTSPPEVDYHPEIPHGAITDTTLRSDVLDNSRLICVYTPPHYQRGTDRYPVVLFHDGLDFLSMGHAKNILDYLIARKRMAPVIAVFVPPVDRNAEYAGTQMDAFYSFILDELLPFVDRSYRTSRFPADRATIGVSNSGNMSLWLGLHYPETFGKIAAQSPNIVSTVSNGYENSPRLGINFYLDIGAYDQEQLIPLVKNFADIISAKGYSHMYRKYHEGHSWGNWRGHVGRALEFFFPPKKPFIIRRQRNRSQFIPMKTVSTT
jgi:enterochelin esterase-like enzyme